MSAKPLKILKMHHKCECLWLSFLLTNAKSETNGLFKIIKILYQMLIANTKCIQLYKSPETGKCTVTTVFKLINPVYLFNQLSKVLTMIDKSLLGMLSMLLMDSFVLINVIEHIANQLVIVPKVVFSLVKIMVINIFIDTVLVIMFLLLNVKKPSNKFIRVMFHYCLEPYVPVQIVKHMDFVVS